MRNLASIQKITNIHPIEGADRIECAEVLGWECVIQKDEFKVGDLVVYVEVDSIMPIKPEFEFLRVRKFRIRTIRLKKQISQGICFPLSILPSRKYKEGDDVTDIIGVTKYDPEAIAEALEEARMNSTKKNFLVKFLMRYKWYRRFFTKSGKRGWPEFIQKTDETRIQAFPHICEKEKFTVFTATEKLDGQSATYALKRLPKRWWHLKQRYQFFVCSRNVHLRTEHVCSYWEMAIKYNIKKILHELIDNNEFVILQGEIIGEGIQKNKYKITGRDFYGFNLIFPSKKCDDLDMRTSLMLVGIKSVPLVDKAFVLENTIQECVELSKGKSKIADVKREGLVIRNYDKDISIKIINPEFLLQYQDENEE